MTRLWKHRWLRALVVGGAAAALAAGLYRSGALDGLEAKSLDFRFRLLARPDRADPSVVMVTVDQSSLADFKEEKQYWPWPRDFYALLTSHLSKGGARAVAFDILFPDPDIDRLNSSGQGCDSDFADAIRNSGRVVLAAFLGDDPGAAPLSPRFGIEVAAPLATRVYREATTPLPAFQEGAARVGAVNYLEDDDGVFRRTRLVFRYGEMWLPTLSLAVLLQTEGQRSVERGDDDTVRVGRTEIPLSRDGAFLAYWYGRGGPRGVFKYIPFSHLLVSARLELAGRTAEAKYPSSWFKDKVVVVGTNAPGLFDFKATPFTYLEAYPGMEIHATLISNFLHHDFLRDTERWVTVALIALLALLAGAIFFFSPSPSRATLGVAALEAAFLVAAAIAFAARDRWIEVAAPSFALVATLMAAGIVSYITEGRAKREIRKVFDRYVSPAVVSELLQDPGRVDLGGKVVEATVFFSDLANFTTLSEKCQPAELVGYLNDYFSRATESILEKEAMLDKYIGDAIMAVFGAPVPSEKHAQNACRAALEIQRHTFLYGQGKHDPPIEFITRIGINSGKMVVGNIGSSKRLDYTAIGDNVNLGSRLEGVNKVYGTRIMVSEFTRELVKSEFVLRELDLLTVKGKTRPIRIYELVGQEVSPEGREQIARFEEALALYRGRRFAEALAAFENIRARDPSDSAAAEYVGRCRTFQEHPPPEHWDGVYALTYK